MKKVVYSNYSQEALDLEYDMRRRCPHFAETFESLEPLNLRMRNNYECMLDVEFGNTDLQMDLDEILFPQAEIQLLTGKI